MPDVPTRPDILDALRTIVGPAGLLADPADVAPFCMDWRGLYHGRTLAVLRPGTAAELGEAVGLLAARGISLVPQGGNTGLAGGATPDASGAQVIVSLARMSRVRAVAPADMTLTVEAGATWQAAQHAAAEAGCLLPLSIASEGSAQVGGILSTNAGGNLTVRHGNARELVLGLEVVLADGQVWNGLRSLRKDNTGYCLKQIFIGAEGTLGVITAAVLRLVPRPTDVAVGLCSLPSADAALDLFRRLQRDDDAALQAFEYMSGASMDLVLRHIPGAKLPLAVHSGHFVLVELATSRAAGGMRAQLEAVLELALAEGVVVDAVLAETEAQRLAIWRLREDHSEAQRLAGASVKNDVSVPVSRVPALLQGATAACEALLPGIRAVPFGHLGDGNIHMNLSQPEGAAAGEFLARAAEITAAVNRVVQDLGGSFSAEHGVGQLKTGLMAAWRGGAELQAMRRIKQALDPKGIMNPGKVLPEPRGDAEG